MPYQGVKELPRSLTEKLPRHAQEIYVKSYDNAWEQYAKPNKRRRGGSREQTAHRVAWAAVKKQYKKDDDGKWRRK